MIRIDNFRGLVGIPQLRQQFNEALALSRHLQHDYDYRTGQLVALSAIWSDCVSDIPYYRRLVARDEAPASIRTWGDLNNIPVLQRQILQEHASEFIRISGPPDSFVSTAGSTGQPVQLGQWRTGLEPLRVAKLVPWVRLGYNLNDAIYLIWGHAHLLGTGWRRYYNHAIRKTKDWLAGYHRVDAYTMDKNKAAHIAREIIRIRPAGLIGYAAVLDLLCRYTTEFHADLYAAGLKFVMPCAEPPPRQDTFELFHSVFGCPIVQEFGGVDFGHVGFKIDAEPYMLFPDLNILETESDAAEPDTGAALVTTLYRRYVPLIRYRQGDVITGIQRDEQGLVTAFDEQIGRVNDMICLSDGSSVHSVAIVHCFKDEPSIYNVQLLLRDEGPAFSLVVHSPISTDVEQRMRNRLRQIHPQFEQASFSYVMDLATNLAGKRRWVVDQRTSPAVDAV